MNPRHVLARLLEGAVVGGLLGLCLCIAFARAVNGALWVPGTILPANVGTVLRYLIPFTVAGAVAGALIGTLLPVMRSRTGALVVTGAAFALYFMFGRWLHAGRTGFDAEFLGLALLGTAAFIPMGLFIRDVAFHDDPDILTLEQRTTSLIWAVLDRMYRLPGIGFSLRHRRQERIRAQPFPAEWLTTLSAHVPLYDRLPAEDQRELQRQIMVFVAEKRIEGRGVRLSDTIRVTIAAQACLLTLHLDADYYPKLRTILVYPRSFVPKRSSLVPHGSLEPRHAVLGESWGSRVGVVVLSWKDVRKGAADPRDGQNVVLHEFAHQLDQEDGTADGMPIMDPPSTYQTWARVLQESFQRLQRAEVLGEDSVLNYYGATDPAEFFAVATETFFERPQELRIEQPELYHELRQYYRQDPAAYVIQPAPQE